MKSLTQKSTTRLLCSTIKPLAAALALIGGTASAGQLVYTPVNPSFGGSPLNGPYLLQKAERQNDFQQPMDDLDIPDFPEQPSSTDQFKQMLENAVLSRVNSAVISNLFGDDGKLVAGGELKTLNYTIKVSPVAVDGKLTLTIIDNKTNQQTQIEMPS